MAKLDTKGTSPMVDRPAATPIMLASAMPQSKKRSGATFWNMAVQVETDRSASSTTSSGCSAANACRVAP